MTLFHHSSTPAPADSRAAASCGRVLAFAAVAWLCLWGSPAVAQQAAAGIEAEELKTALEVARKQLSVTEAKVGELEKSRKDLQQSVAEANRVTEEIRGQYEELLLRMASFGVDLVKPDEKSLEQRLLSAVRDRDAVETQKNELARHLVQLSEATVVHLQSSTPEARTALERELTAASGALAMASGAKTASQARPLADARVVSYDSEIGLVVLNAGRASGLRVGMPLNVKRDERPVSTALVVDVRDSIAGALLQEVVSTEEVKVGDRIEPRPDTL